MKRLSELRFLAKAIVGLCLFLPVTAWPCISSGIDNTDASNNEGFQIGDDDATCPTNSETAVDSGNLTVDHTLAGCRSLGRARALRLIYSSLKADPQPTVSTVVGIAKEPNIQTVSSRLDVLEVFQGKEIFTDLRGFGEDPNLAESEQIRQVLQFDASQLETGLYPYILTTVFKVPGSELDGEKFIVRGSVLVNNQQGSAFGAGWTLDGVASLVILEDQSILLVEGDGSTRFFEKLTNRRFSSPVGDFSSLVRNPDGSYTRTEKDGTENDFDANGRQTDSVDRNGNTTKYGYSPDGLLTSITDPIGRVTTLSYDDSLLDRIVDPADRETTFKHEGRDLVRIADPDGSHREFAYDSRHRMISETSKRGFTATYEYNFAGRNVRVVRPDGSVNSISPSQTLGLADLQSGQGTRDNPAPPLRARDIRARFVDANGNVTRFEANEFGTATLVIDALGGTTTANTNNSGLPTKIERANGAVIRLKYDERGNLIQQSPGAARSFAYEPKFNQLTRVTDAKGNVTRFKYDKRGNLVAIIDAKAQRRSLSYDARGLLTSVTDPVRNTTTFEYDASGNLVKTIDPLGNITALAYDKASNVSSSTNPKGNTTFFEYDPLNRLVEVKEPTGGVSTYKYDENGNLIRVTDANGHTTSFRYDKRDRLMETVDPTGNKESVQYDGNGNVRSITNRNGEAITSEYDALNRLIKKSLPGNQVTAFAYDEVGNLTNVDDPDSRLTLSYDAEDRLISASTAGSPTQPPLTIEYRYDRNGNCRNTTDSLTARTLSYQYDALDQVTAITKVRFAYDTRRLLKRTERTNDVTTIRGYDAANQLAELRHRRDEKLLSSFQFSYDPVGNRTNLDTTRKDIAVTGTLAYSYDPLERLTRAAHPLPGQPDEVFVYDAVGNRLQRDGQARQAVFDDVNRLLEDQDFIYAYDANGNLIEKTEKATSATTVYTYDVENRLIRIDLPAGKVATYRYDGLGRRIEKDVDSAITRYVYDQEDILLEFDGANTLLARYTHGLGVDEPLTMERDLDKDGAFERNERFFYQTDALGSVTELTDASGNVAQVYVYDAFGRLVQQIGSRANPYTYTGREFDQESGLYYYRARYYDPGIGRFIQEDPFRGVLTQPSTLNLYAYVGNNPINRQDAFGLQDLSCCPPMTSCVCPPTATTSPPPSGSQTSTLEAISSDLAKATVVGVATGAVGGAMVVGAAGTVVVPGIGTLTGAAAGGLVGGLMGGIAGFTQQLCENTFDLLF